MAIMTLAARCDELNEAARKIVAEEGLSPFDALISVARSYRMFLVRGDDQSRIYQLKDGTLVNLWIDAPGSGIQDGGLGFDDQIEPYG